MNKNNKKTQRPVNFSFTKQRPPWQGSLVTCVSPALFFYVSFPIGFHLRFRVESSDFPSSVTRGGRAAVFLSVLLSRKWRSNIETYSREKKGGGKEGAISVRGTLDDVESLSKQRASVFFPWRSGNANPGDRGLVTW